LNTHVPLGLWIAVPSAVVIVYVLLTTGVWRVASGEIRYRVMIGLTWWLSFFTALAAVGAFAANYHRPVAAIAFGIVVPIVVGLVLLGRSPALNHMLDQISPRALIGVQFYRVLGGLFIIGWATGHIPAVFALPAGIGDVAVGLAAPYLATRLGDGTERSRRLAVAWNIFGIADFASAVALGAATSPSPLWPTLLGHPNPLISRLPFVLIPVFLVPVSALLHIVTLRRLAAPASQLEQPLVDASGGRRVVGIPAAR
jgi:hypothetical protein